MCKNIECIADQSKLSRPVSPVVVCLLYNLGVVRLIAAQGVG